MKYLNRACAALCALALVANIARAGPDWVERRDAGSNTAGAQLITVPGQLSQVNGGLGGDALTEIDFEDCYFFSITEAQSFRISLVGDGLQVSLFSIVPDGEGWYFARGLLATRDVDGVLVLDSTATDGTESQVSEPGDYMFAISFSNNQPISPEGEIFTFDSPSEISGPDGPGGAFFHSGWSDSLHLGGGNLTPIIEYQLEFISSGGTSLPAPGAAVVLLAGTLMARRRR